MALRGMWASMWSRRGDRAEAGLLERMRVPRRLRARVEVMATAPLSGDGITAEVLEARVRALRGDAA